MKTSSFSVGRSAILAGSTMMTMGSSRASAGTLTEARPSADIALPPEGPMRNPWTSIVIEPLIPSVVAVTVADPCATPETSPAAFTEATAGSLDAQLISRSNSSLPVPSRTVAWSCRSPATATSGESAVSVTEATAAGSAGGGEAGPGAVGPCESLQATARMATSRLRDVRTLRGARRPSRLPTQSIRSRSRSLVILGMLNSPS